MNFDEKFGKIPWKISIFSLPLSPAIIKVCFVLGDIMRMRKKKNIIYTQ